MSDYLYTWIERFSVSAVKVLLRLEYHFVPTSGDRISLFLLGCIRMMGREKI
jgi:hypothetical protein